MIRYRLGELIAEKRFQEGRRITLADIAKASGVNQATLSKLINQRTTSTTTEVLEKLCVYFQVPIEALIEIVSDRKPGRRKTR